ncbi:DUF3037 domain-containing protein [Brevundimonas sp. Leaf168]|uniref:DUF3037 domain-containing protein n=1 Tax=Brevundimonas sp. Leaf168 TaxID=1736283 RepID=UPI00138ED22E|nr:DUF3037 domain-containing protein [Brevundimonas sp. Leaf168]
MMRHSGYYALLQYSPQPERQEFLNFGVLLVVPALDFADVAIAKGSARMERIFEGIPKARFEEEKRGFGNRIKMEFARRRSVESLDELSRKLANDFRISELRSVAVDDPEQQLQHLFKILVGDEEPKKKAARISTRMRNAFIAKRIVQYLDNPPAVNIPEAGIQINAPFGYQNGAYNLIDGVRISGNPSEDMKETGRRAIEGGLLWKHFENSPDRKRLIVVGDFSRHEDKFYDAVGDLLEENHVRLYRLDSLDPLLDDIRENAALHG